MRHFGVLVRLFYGLMAERCTIVVNYRQAHPLWEETWIIIMMKTLPMSRMYVEPNHFLHVIFCKTFPQASSISNQKHVKSNPLYPRIFLCLDRLKSWRHHVPLSRSLQTRIQFALKTWCIIKQWRQPTTVMIYWDFFYMNLLMNVWPNMYWTREMNELQRNWSNTGRSHVIFGD